MTQRQTLLRLEPSENFVVTPFIENICERARAYLEAGYAVHLSGPAGSGKTTLALHLAARLGRPVMLICGDEEFGSSDLVGSAKGVVSRRLIDNFIHSVLKTEESVHGQWVDHRLVTACERGYTLIYDEFSRSHAEANNPLLPVLEEGVLALPEGRQGESYLRVTPDFRAIFTSNPDEYAGVYTPQSALLDRMITIRLEGYDRPTEVAITAAHSALSPAGAARVVDVVRAIRAKNADSVRQPTVRACIMIASVLRLRGGRAQQDDPIFLQTCLDVLSYVPDAGVRIQKAMQEVLGQEVLGEEVVGEEVLGRGPRTVSR